MRITNGMLVNNMMSNLNSNLNRMERYQRQGASGRLFDKPSDDPIGMSKSLKLYTDISKVGQYERNLNDASSWMHTTENALTEMQSILQRTRELSVDAANGTKTEEDTQNIAEELKHLKEQVIKLGNMRHAGRSIFTGFKTDKDLFNPDGTYNIDLNAKDVSNYNVGISEEIDINIVGMKLFGSISKDNIIEDNLAGKTEVDSADKNDMEKVREANRKKENLEMIKAKIDGVGGINIDSISSYDDLPKMPADETQIEAIKTELGITGESNDPDEIWVALMHDHGRVHVDLAKGFENSQTSKGEQSTMIKMFDDILVAMDKGEHEKIDSYLDNVDLVLGNVTSIKAEIGAKTNRLKMTEKRLSSEKLNFESNLSRNEDVDYGELIMKSKLAETVYNVSLAISSKVIQPTLMDFLR